MRFDEASRRQHSVVSALVDFILNLFGGFQSTRLTEESWESLLRFSYPEVERARYESAEIARDFYDSQRLEHVGETVDLNLPAYRFEWFAENMESAKRAFLEEKASENSLSQVALHAAKEVENGWRKALIRAVQEDPINTGEVEIIDNGEDGAEIIDHGEDEDTAEVIDRGEDEAPPRLRPVPRRVLWARVATGAETCGFCMMLVSRGGVYLSAESAGLNTSDTKAIELIDKGDEQSIDAAMTRWHPGCDCRVVPIFDESNWSGRDAYLRAERIWREVTRGLSGRDAMNAFRRAIESGEYDIDEFATAA